MTLRSLLVGLGSAAIAAAELVGCAQVLGVDGYEEAPPSAPPADDAGQVGLPLLPALPDVGRRAQCEQCVAKSCKKERTICESSPRCRAMLACQGRCDDPSCITACTDTLPRSADFLDYFDCAFGVASNVNSYPSQCHDECGVGSNWECTGSYAWTSLPGSHEVTEHVQLELLGTGALAPEPLMVPKGVMVAACSDILNAAPAAGDTNCGDWRSVDPYGRVDVSLVPNAFSASTAFSIRGGAGELHRVYPRPIARSGPLEIAVFSMVSPYNYLNYILAGTRDFARSLGVISFHSFDCLGVLATTQAELGSHGGEKRQYIDPPDPTLDKGLSGIFYNVPPSGAVQIIASADIGGAVRQVSRRTVMVAVGCLTTVALYPSN